MLTLWFGLSQLTPPGALGFRMLPLAAKHAMGTLKRSPPRCYRCFERPGAPLAGDAAFFRRRLGPSHMLDGAACHPSLWFVV